MCNLINTHTHTQYTHTHTQIPPWEDGCEWHRMTRMTGPDCAVTCNLINTHTHTHKHGCSGQCVRSPGVGKGPLRERDRNSSRQSVKTRRRGGGKNILAPPPCAPWEEAPVRTLDNKTMQTAMVKLRGARQNSTIVFIKNLRVSRKDRIEGPLLREIKGKSLGSHYAAELVGGTCRGKDWGQASTLYPVQRRK